MKIECGNCHKTDRGRYKKLVKKGWKIFFLYDKQKVIRCKECKPNWKDKIKSTFNKDYKPEMYYGIKEIMDKLKLLRGLKTKEELREEGNNRRMKKRKHYEYQRNNRKKEGSTSKGEIR